MKNNQSLTASPTTNTNNNNNNNNNTDIPSQLPPSSLLPPPSPPSPSSSESSSPTVIISLDAHDECDDQQEEEQQHHRRRRSSSLTNDNTETYNQNNNHPHTATTRATRHNNHHRRKKNRVHFLLEHDNDTLSPPSEAAAASPSRCPSSNDCHVTIIIDDEIKNFRQCHFVMQIINHHNMNVTSSSSSSSSSHQRSVDCCIATYKRKIHDDKLTLMPITPCTTTTTTPKNSEWQFIVPWMAIEKLSRRRQQYTAPNPSLSSSSLAVTAAPLTEQQKTTLLQQVQRHLPCTTNKDDKAPVYMISWSPERGGEIVIFDHDGMQRRAATRRPDWLLDSNISPQRQLHRLLPPIVTTELSSDDSNDDECAATIRLVLSSTIMTTKTDRHHHPIDEMLRSLLLEKELICRKTPVASVTKLKTTPTKTSSSSSSLSRSRRLTMDSIIPQPSSSFFQEDENDNIRWSYCLIESQQQPPSLVGRLSLLNLLLYFYNVAIVLTTDRKEEEDKEGGETWLLRPYSPHVGLLQEITPNGVLFDQIIKSQQSLPSDRLSSSSSSRCFERVFSFMYSSSDNYHSSSGDGVTEKQNFESTTISSKDDNKIELLRSQLDQRYLALSSKEEIQTIETTSSSSSSCDDIPSLYESCLSSNNPTVNTFLTQHCTNITQLSSIMPLVFVSTKDIRQRVRERKVGDDDNNKLLLRLLEIQVGLRFRKMLWGGGEDETTTEDDMIQCLSCVPFLLNPANQSFANVLRLWINNDVNTTEEQGSARDGSAAATVEIVRRIYHRFGLGGSNADETDEDNDRDSDDLPRLSLKTQKKRFRGDDIILRTVPPPLSLPSPSKKDEQKPSSSSKNNNSNNNPSNSSSIPQQQKQNDHLFTQSISLTASTTPSKNRLLRRRSYVGSHFSNKLSNIQTLFRVVPSSSTTLSSSKKQRRRSLPSSTTTNSGVVKRPQAIMMSSNQKKRRRSEGVNNNNDTTPSRDDGRVSKRSRIEKKKDGNNIKSPPLKNNDCQTSSSSAIRWASEAARAAAAMRRRQKR